MKIMRTPKTDYHDYSSKNGYGLSARQILHWVNRHKQAYERHDIRTMEWIEDMLENINYHWECSYLLNHDYNHLILHYGSPKSLSYRKALKEEGLI